MKVEKLKEVTLDNGKKVVYQTGRHCWHEYNEMGSSWAICCMCGRQDLRRNVFMTTPFHGPFTPLAHLDLVNPESREGCKGIT